MNPKGSRRTYGRAALAASILALALGGCAGGGGLTARDSRPREFLSSLETVSASGEQGKQDPAGYPVKIVFATPEGAYVRDVKVSFQKDGQMREVFSEGPWLYVKGSPGRYHVQAEGKDGRAAGANFNIPDRRGARGGAPEVVILNLVEGGAGRGGPSTQPEPAQPERQPEGGLPGQNPPGQSQPGESPAGK